MTQSIQLIVQEADRSDAGKGIARIGTEAMARLSVEPGDPPRPPNQLIGEPGDKRHQHNPGHRPHPNNIRP